MAAGGVSRQGHASGLTYPPAVRWDELFADLSGQGEADEAASLAAEVADRSRWEAGQSLLTDRARGWEPRCAVAVGLPAGESARGPLLAVGQDWLVIGDGTADCLVPAAAVIWLKTDGPDLLATARAQASRGAGASVHRLRLVHALRLLVRDRAYVRIRLVDGETVSGTVDRAGPDHVDLALHPADVPRRATAVQSTWVLPYAGIASIRGGQVWNAP
jgi:hypothetical protein